MARAESFYYTMKERIDAKYANNRTACLFVGIYMFFLTGLFGISGYENTIKGTSILCGMVVVMMFFAKRRHSRMIYNPFPWLIPLLLFIPWLCGITKMIMYGGIPIDKSVVMMSFPWLLYYVFIDRCVSEDSIVKAFIVIGLMLLTIQVFQVVLPERAIFGVYDDDHETMMGEVSEVRNGLNRYRLGNWELTLFCLYYAWQKLLEKYTPKRLFLFLAFIISMYLHLTRQIMFSSVIALCSTMFFLPRTKIKKWMIVSIAMFAMVVAFYYEVLFSEFAEKAGEEVSNDDNVRWLSISYFGSRIFTNPLTILFGNGHPADMDWLAELYGLYPSDIGFIGQAYSYGLLWIILWLYNIWIILYKYRRVVPLYLKLYVFGSTLHSWGMFPYRYASENLLWVSMLYITALYINGKRSKVSLFGVQKTRD